jgi:hypothetical protein
MSCRQLGALLAPRTSTANEAPAWPDEWNDLVASAVAERVAGALSRAVRDRAGVPETARHELARELYRAGAFNLLLYRELARVLRANPTSSPPVVLKGGALATTVYDDIAHRPMSDLDLLVRRGDISRWKDCLERLDYELASPEMAEGLADEVHYQLAFRGGPHRDVVIELHWNLVAGAGDWRAPDVEWFWRQTEPWPGVDDLACPPALQLTTAANVVYLSAHAMLQHGHARTRLVWLLDIHRLITVHAPQPPSGLDWSELVDQARHLRWDAAVSRALEQCVSLFGTPVPDSILASLRQAASSRALGHVLDKTSVEASRADAVLRELRCLDAPSRRRLVRAILLPTPEYVKWRYPRARAFWPLAYVYRWGVVGCEGVAYAGRVLTRALSFVFL